MKWTPEALELVRSLKTNCVDFIYGAAEYIAETRGRKTVQIEDVQTVLSWMESTKEQS
jgi:histone H3/H4